MAEIRTLKLNLLADVANFSRGLGDAQTKFAKFGKALGNVAKKITKAFAVVAAASGTMAIKVGIDAAKAASDMSEEISKASTIFGEGAKEIEAFSATAAKSLGLSKIEAMKANSTFAILGKGAGLTGKDLTKFSKSATTLAADLGSFFNTNADEAITAIGAALRGESEPIRKYGVLLNDATIKAKAMEMGLYDGKGAIDIQAKSLAAYEVILEQTTDAQGDFARTSDGAAGQMKIFQAEMDNLKVTFGNNLLPVMTNVVKFANEKLIPVIKNIADGFSGNRGGLSERAEELGASLDSRTGFSLGESIRALADAFTNLFKIITDDGDETTTFLTTLANSLQTIANAINAIADAYQRALPALRFLGNEFRANIPQAGFRSFTAGRAAGGSVMGGQSYRVGEFGSEIFTPSGSGSIRPDRGGHGNTFILNGIIDAESARRSIERVLQNSTLRTGQVNLAGSPL